MNKFALLVTFLLFSTAQSGAQSVSFTVFGTVRDQSGANVPGATVTLSTSGGNSGSRTTRTTLDGAFSFDRVTAGNYNVQVQQEGFKVTTSRLSVSNRQPRPVDLKLEIADLQQEITVAADVNQVSIQSDENRDVAALDRNALDNTPIFDQNYIATISRFLDSGALGTGGATLIMDGLQVNSVSLPPSAIQEVKINQNPYSPEFLRPGRGRIEVVTKAGARDYHGSLNFVFRDNRFNAREPFAATKPQEQRRILETSLTGPIGSGKTSSFLFAGSYNSEDAQSIVYAIGPSGEIRTNVATPQREADVSLRLSHQFGSRNTVSLRYEGLDQYTKNQGVGGVVLPETARNFRNREDTLTYTQSTTITPKLINDFRILFGKEYQPIRSVQSAPKIVVLDAFTSGGAQADRLQTEYHTAFHDTLGWSHGKHTIKAGIDSPDISRRGLEDHTNFQGTYTFASLQDYQSNRFLSFVQQAGQDKVIFWEKVLAGFFLDDIRLRPNLTVSLAARYDWQNYFNDTNNVSPRIAFAFSPASHPKTVIRGGAGYFYDRTGANPIFDILRYDGVHLLQYVVTDQGQIPNTLITKLAPDVRIPYLLQFGVGVERQLTKATTISFNYTGSDTTGAFRSRDINAPLPPFYAARPNLNYSIIRQIESSGRAESHSLDISVRGKVTHFFSGLMQYTLARAYNDTSGITAYPANNYDLSGEWSRADFDQRHRFNLLGTINAGKLFNVGVGVSLNTGRPYSLTTGRDDYHTSFATARPPGVGRNTLQGPAYAEFDLRWSRDFRLAPPHHEVAPTVTISMDAFNVLNQVNYTSYVGNSNSPLFGHAVSAQPPRRLQLSTRFSF
jgi:hypothetical protein